MSITDQSFINQANDEDYLFKFFSDDVASSVSEYSSESSSPQAVPSSSPENCSWDPFELNPL